MINVQIFWYFAVVEMLNCMEEEEFKDTRGVNSSICTQATFSGLPVCYLRQDLRYPLMRATGKQYYRM